MEKTKVTKRSMLSFGLKTLETYKQLSRQLAALSGAKELTNRDAFLIALMWGFKNGSGPVDSFVKSPTGVRLEFLKDEDIALMAAVQLAVTKDPESLLDFDQRLDLAERYAETGILLLGKMLDEPGDFARAFAAEIMSMAGEQAALAQE